VKTKRMTCRAFVKSVNEADRTVEQIVSVFNNVDFANDRVKLGAFEGTLERWKSSGDPIPAIWSHTWDDPFAHIGAVLEAKELAPGDPMLPPEIADLGGLYTKYQVDDLPFASQVFHLLLKRRVREASFAYDVLKERKAEDGANDLLELDLIEIGPTLKGMNPMTQLLAAKALEAAAQTAGVDVAVFEKGLRQLFTDEKGEYLSHVYLPGEEDRCVVCGQTRNTLPHLNFVSAAPEGAKAWVTLTGSMEEMQDAVYDEVTEWAQDEFGGELYDVRLEATYDDRVVFQVELWEDPLGGGDFYQATYTVGADPDEAEGEDDDPGPAVEIGEVVPVTIEGMVVPKSRKSRRRRGIAASDGSPSRAIKPGTVASIGNEPTKSKGKPKEPAGAKGKDLGTEDGTGSGMGEAERLALELDLLELT
jgi:HK97 family phage prohead protease